MSISHGALTGLLEQLVEFAPDALLVIDARGCIVLVNSTAETLFGFDPQELVGQPIERLVPRRLHSAHARHRGDYSHNPRTREMGAGVSDLVAARKDGSEFPVEIRLSPLQVDGASLTAAAVRDVTERRQVARELQQARQEAEQANIEKSRFLATASHDLRQPLQALQLLNAALRKQTDDLAMLEMLTHESDALESMGKLLNALLDISKLEAGSIKPELEEVNLAELCQALQQQFLSLADARGLKLTIAASAHYIHTDRTLFRQLLENLLANALKYTETGSVQLTCRTQQNTLRITISDTGIGIAPENLHHIFDEFYQIQRNGRKGVGLGLAIVKRIARLLGMTIEVESKLNGGTQFHVIVPETLISKLIPTNTATAPKAFQGVLSRALVLLIEDDAAVRNATAFYLKTMGHTVVTAAGVEEAETALQTMGKKPDFILSDYHLGQNETGVDAIQRIRLAHGKQIPALLLSGDTSAAMREIADVQHCQVLSKPVDAPSLTGAIQKLLLPRAEVP